MADPILFKHGRSKIKHHQTITERGHSGLTSTTITPNIIEVSIEEQDHITSSFSILLRITWQKTKSV